MQFSKRKIHLKNLKLMSVCLLNIELLSEIQIC